MKRLGTPVLLLTGVLLLIPGHGDAETRTLSWGAVTAYTDNTPIGPTVTVTYNVFWTDDPGLIPASLRTVASSVAQTSRAFDPDALGIPRGQTSYFTLETVLGTGEKSALSPAYPWVAPVLSGLAISGPSSVNANGSGTYVATATWSDGSTTRVTPTWSENSAFASISATGMLTTLAVTSNQLVTVSASYASGGVIRTATAAVTIGNIPLPAAPMNMILSGPVQSSPVKLFRLGWDPVTTYMDGSPIGTETIRYSAYWTTDEHLSVGNLRALAISIQGTSVTFDPAAEGMVQNQRVYLTTRAALATGQQSPMLETLTWVAINEGPIAPSNPTIRKQ